MEIVHVSLRQTLSAQSCRVQTRLLQLFPIGGTDYWVSILEGNGLSGILDYIISDDSSVSSLSLQEEKSHLTERQCALLSSGFLYSTYASLIGNFFVCFSRMKSRT